MAGANEKNNIIYSNSMNRQDLEKLSVDELIKMNQLSKDDIINMMLSKKPKEQPVTPEVLVTPKPPVNKFVKKVREIVKERFHSLVPDEGIKVNWPSKSVLVYARRPISIAQMRYDELDAANMSCFEPGSTFLDLFNDRLKNILGKRQKIQITIDADGDHTINNNCTDQQNLWSIQNIDSNIR